MTANASPTSQELAVVAASMVGLCRAIVPDLAGRPLYVLWRRELTEGISRNGVTDGCTSTQLDLIARPAIGDKWAGRGPAILLNDQSLWRLAAQRTKKYPGGTASARIHFAECVCPAVALHELGHVCESGFDRPEVTRPDRYAEKLLPEFRNFLATTKPTRLEKTDLHHGAAWIRCTLHLHHRAMKAKAFLLLGLELGRLVLNTEAYSHAVREGTPEYDGAVKVAAEHQPRLLRRMHELDQQTEEAKLEMLVP